MPLKTCRFMMCNALVVNVIKQMEHLSGEIFGYEDK